MRRGTIAILTSAGLAALGLCRQAQAQITESEINSTTPTTTAWNAPGTLVFQTGQYIASDSGGTTNDNDNWGGNANGANGFGALAEAFIVNQSGTLDAVNIVMAGSTATFNVELYALGAPQAGYQAPSGSAPQITQINAEGSAVSAGSGGTYNGGTNLLNPGDSFTYTADPNSALCTLTFAESVSLSTGQLYVLSLDPTANADSTWWQRGGLPSNSYNNGEGLNEDGVDGQQAFEGKSSVRDFDSGVTISVPEPVSFGMLGIGAASLLVRRRRKLA